MYTPYGLPKFERLRRRQRDETMNDDDRARIRQQALMLAIDQVPNGTVWEVIFGLAHKFETFIIHGTWDTPLADAEKAANK